jgi:nicotinamidase-related amidase
MEDKWLSRDDASVSKFKQAAFDDIFELFDHGKRRHTFVGLGRRLNLNNWSGRGSQEKTMTTTATPANFDGQRPAIDPDDAVMLLIDHQNGLFQTVGDIPVPELRVRAAALAKMATLANLPVITTASVPEGPNGPLISEIHQNAPHTKYVARNGEINAWDSPDVVAAVKATGRKTLIIAGAITSVCLAFPAIAAAHEGYKVFAVVDASGTYSEMAEQITLARIVQAGVVPIDTAAVASELQKTWNRNDADDWAELYTQTAARVRRRGRGHWRSRSGLPSRFGRRYPRWWFPRNSCGGRDAL